MEDMQPMHPEGSYGAGVRKLAKDVRRPDEGEGSA